MNTRDSEILFFEGRATLYILSTDQPADGGTMITAARDYDGTMIATTGTMIGTMIS